MNSPIIYATYNSDPRRSVCNQNQNQQPPQHQPQQARNDPADELLENETVNPNGGNANSAQAQDEEYPLVGLHCIAHRTMQPSLHTLYINYLTCEYSVQLYTALFRTNSPPNC